MKAKDGVRGGLKKRSVSVIALLTLLVQYRIGVKNGDSVKDSFREIQKSQVAQIRSEIAARDAKLHESLERDFVRKAEMSPSLERIGKRLDRVFDSQSDMNAKIARIEGYFRSQRSMSQVEGATLEVSHR